jgi:putative membrane protein
VIGWRYWHHNPAAVAIIIGLGWLYALAAGPGRARLAPGRPFDRVRAILFYSGLTVGYLAVGSPLAGVGEVYLFTAHLVQQLLILYLAAALVLLGLPEWMIDGWAARPGVRPVLRWKTQPVVAGAFFVLAVSAWYIPRLYEGALENEAVRLLQYVMFGIAGLLFWWPLLSPSRILPPIGYGGRLLYLSSIEVVLTGVFSYVLMAEHAMYPTYAYAPRLIPGLSALDDQILAGIMLSGISSLVLVGALGVNFYRWARRDR